MRRRIGWSPVGERRPPELQCHRSNRGVSLVAGERGREAGAGERVWGEEKK